jgi:hypothetical protein
MDQSDPSIDPRIGSYLAECRALEAERLGRLRALGLGPHDPIEVSDPIYCAYQEIQQWYSEQQQRLWLEIEADCEVPPALPFAWEGEFPIDQHGNYGNWPRDEHGKFLDFGTLEGLNWYVKEQVELFHSRLHERYPSRPDGLRDARHAVCNAYRMARDLGFISNIPLSEEIKDANAIENCWHRLTVVLENTGQGVKSAEAVWIGHGRVRIGNQTITLESQLADVLQALVELQSATKPELQKQSGRDQPDKLLKKLVTNHPQLKQYIRFPGGRGKGGYGTTIVARSI